jgi:16S rRNA (guanine527-N7)-methyltransferase
LRGRRAAGRRLTGFPPNAPAPLRDLEPQARDQLAIVLDLLASDPASLSSIRDPADGWRVHVADSLSGLELIKANYGAGPRIADIGAGAGFPGITLAAALPGATVDLIESVGRKCEFMRRALSASGLANAQVVCQRSEEWAKSPPPAGGREGYDLVTARAVGRLSTLAELAAPLLRSGGALLAWKGRRNADEEAELARAAAELAMRRAEVTPASALSGSPNRHLHLIRKVAPTPAGLPRRAGIAKKRPAGSRPISG